MSWMTFATITESEKFYFYPLKDKEKWFQFFFSVGEDFSEMKNILENFLKFSTL